MARAIPYKEAIQWMVYNDDVESMVGNGEPIPTVSAVLVSAIYQKDVDVVVADVQKEYAENA